MPTGNVSRLQQFEHLVHTLVIEPLPAEKFRIL